MALRPAAVIGGLVAWATFGVTAGWGIVLAPDVGLMQAAGFSIWPSPGSTLLASAGYIAFCAVHSLAAGGVAFYIARARPALWSVAAALPVLLWLLPLGVDALACLLLVDALRRSSSAGLAGFVHLAAIPVGVGILAARARGVLLLVVVVAGTSAALVLLLTTRYAESLSFDPWIVAQGLPPALVVLAIGAAPFLFARRMDVPVAVGCSIGVALIVLYSSVAHEEDGVNFGLSVFTLSRYVLPLTVLLLVVQADGRAERPKTAPGKGWAMKLKLRGAILAVTALGALVVSQAALAVTVPAVPVDDYGDALLDGLLQALTAIFPYAAAITAFAIGVGMVKRWLGHRKATRV